MRQRRASPSREAADLEGPSADGALGAPEGAPDTCKRDADGSGADGSGISLKGDRANLALLLLLYTLQGVPMGLASSITSVLQERGASFADQGASVAAALRAPPQWTLVAPGGPCGAVAACVARRRGIGRPGATAQPRFRCQP
jgi:hypothetical protein